MSVVRKGSGGGRGAAVVSFLWHKGSRRVLAPRPEWPQVPLLSPIFLNPVAAWPWPPESPRPDSSRGSSSLVAAWEHLNPALNLFLFKIAAGILTLIRTSLRCGLVQELSAGNEPSGEGIWGRCPYLGSGTEIGFHLKQDPANPRPAVAK